jgi:hypothetical protein
MNLLAKILLAYFLTCFWLPVIGLALASFLRSLKK